MRKKFKIRGEANSFTLLEMLGVMAVMAILASVAVPPMIRSLQNAQSVNEDKNLEEIGRALCEAVKAEGRVPNPTVAANAVGGWVAMAAPYCSMPSNAIQYVYPDRTETERRLYILEATTPTMSRPLLGAYSVPTDGWNNATWANIQTSFLVLISSSKPDYLLACPANGSATYSAWAGLAGPAAVSWVTKEWVKQAVSGVYSATNTQIVGAVQNGSGTWTNKGQFLHVKVIPMNNLICDVSFGSPPTGGTAGMQIRGQAKQPCVNCYVTKGSTIYATDGVAPTEATATATAASSFLNFNYTPAVSPAPASWAVTP
jgi:type II secretory pathway pseudopilin PulG